MPQTEQSPFLIISFDGVPDPCFPIRLKELIKDVFKIVVIGPPVTIFRDPTALYPSDSVFTDIDNHIKTVRVFG